MKKIQIYCPTCSKVGFVELSEDKLDNKNKNLLAVFIAKDIVCDHSFYVYIDNNFDVRSYYTPDFQVIQTGTEAKDVDLEKAFPSKNEVDVGLIKINIESELFVLIFRAIIYKRQILFISKLEFLFSHLKNFFEYITQNTFDVDISFINPETYDEDEERYEDYVIFEKTNTGFSYYYRFNFRVPEMFEKKEKMMIPQKMIELFNRETDHKTSLLLLKSSLTKAYQMSKTVADYLVEKKMKFNIKKITGLLKDQFSVDITSIYLEFILEIVYMYFLEYYKSI